ncbi:response regulator transcription factor [Saccharibacillus qingshengii]|uniref:response regulator transcription factor n=1 Tax=Saccharibacillus qingshengii TaxID=1763540 RepID=UPI0015548204|nr:response regulator [Saccharibacillus qingshengii]
MNVLIIADDAVVNTAIEKAVRQYDPGCAVFAVSSPREAVNIMSTVSMSIVFSEIEMREMNGLSFIEAQGKFPSAACWVVISEFKNFYDIQKAIRLGAKDYLLKPLDASGIYELLKSRLLHKANTYRHSGSNCAGCI